MGRDRFDFDHADGTRAVGSVGQTSLVPGSQRHLLRLLHLLQACFRQRVLLICLDSEGRTLLDRRVSVA